MIKHRIHFPILIGLSCGLGFVPDLYHVISYEQSRISLVPTILLGSVIGIVLGYGCLIWVRLREKEGVVTLGVGPAIVLTLYVATIYIIPWSNFVVAPDGLCSIMVSKDRIDCGYRLFFIQSLVDLALLLTLYLGGIWYERTRGRLISYHIVLHQRKCAGGVTCGIQGERRK